MAGIVAKTGLIAVAALAAIGLGSGLAGGESGLILFNTRDAIPAEQVEARYRQADGPWDELPINVQFVERPHYDRRLEVGAPTRIEVSYGGATAMLDIVPQDDIRHEIHIVLTDSDPTHGCMGCGGSASAALPGRGDDRRLWIYEGFNGISQRIIF